MSYASNIAKFESSDDFSSSGDETDRSSEICHYTRHVEEKKNWDKFVSTVPEAGSASEKHTDFIQKSSVALKLLTIIFTFGIVLAAGAVSKGALIFMVGQMTIDGNGIETCSNGTLQREESDTVAWLW